MCREYALYVLDKLKNKTIDYLKYNTQRLKFTFEDGGVLVFKLQPADSVISFVSMPENFIKARVINIEHCLVGVTPVEYETRFKFITDKGEAGVVLRSYNGSANTAYLVKSSESH